MARSVRDVALAYSLLAGPDGADGFSTSPLAVDAGAGAASNRPIGVQIVSSWLAESTVLAVASRLEAVSPVRDQHPIL
jgi:aspartyl-tRNA(Asn)/glutamyl-tRNA(Gln) amidotransferase subunit A